MFSGERSRWELTINQYKIDLVNIIGDCAMAASFLSYCGPFDSSYRNQLVNDHWLKTIREVRLYHILKLFSRIVDLKQKFFYINFHELEIPASDNFKFASFMVQPTDIRHWNICGLPTDDFSCNNGKKIICFLF